MDLAEMNGGSIRTNADNYAYGASLIPDEDEMKQFPVKYGVIMDPNGYLIEIKEENKVMIEGNSAKITLHVEDVDESIEFYTNIIGRE